MNAIPIAGNLPQTITPEIAQTDRLIADMDERAWRRGSRAEKGRRLVKRIS